MTHAESARLFLSDLPDLPYRDSVRASELRHRIRARAKRDEILARTPGEGGSR